MRVRFPRLIMRLSQHAVSWIAPCLHSPILAPPGVNRCNDFPDVFVIPVWVGVRVGVGVTVAVGSAVGVLTAGGVLVIVGMCMRVGVGVEVAV